MSDKTSQTWANWCKEGFYAPYIHDPVSGKPSVTLLFPYITFVISIISVVCLHIWPGLFVATVTSLSFWAISVVFYMLRKLQKASFDLDDKKIELSSGE